MKATAQKVKTPGEHINSSKSSEEELIEDNGTFSYGAGAGKTVSFELKQQIEKLKKKSKDDTTAEAIDILSPTTSILNQRTQNKESKNGGKGAKNNRGGRGGKGNRCRGRGGNGSSSSPGFL